MLDVAQELGGDLDPAGAVVTSSAVAVAVVGAHDLDAELDIAGDSTGRRGGQLADRGGAGAGDQLEALDRGERLPAAHRPTSATSSARSSWRSPATSRGRGARTAPGHQLAGDGGGNLGASTSSAGLAGAIRRVSLT